MESLGLSIIIPVYNEEKRINISFDEILSFYNSQLFNKFEVIFVSDGSTDKTVLKINDFIKAHPEIDCRLAGYEINQGKGSAIKYGVSLAGMDYILMADADMSTPLREIEKFIPNILAGDELIIGSRKLKTSNLIKPQGWLRRQVGSAYVLFSRLVTGLKNISDFGCGFKVFRAEMAKKIFPKIKVTGWVFDVEMLYLYGQAGIDIKQIGVNWHNENNSKLRLRDFSKIFFDMLRIR